MKHIKEYNEYVDPFNEDDWDEVELPKPDGTFLTWLKINYPDESKWKNIKGIACYDQKLTDLIGIDKLINLKYLHCGDNQLTELDVSNNINLTHLDCENNQLTKLNVSNNIKLKKLYCRNNQLKELNYYNNINLKFLLK